MWGRACFFEKAQEKKQDLLNEQAVKPFRNAPCAVNMPAKKKQRKEMNVQVLRRPGGAWERLPDGGKGRQLWKNQGGRRTLTPFGRQRLAGWQDLTVHVPVLEYEFENELRGYNPNAKMSGIRFLSRRCRACWKPSRKASQ